MYPIYSMPTITQCANITRTYQTRTLILSDELWHSLKRHISLIQLQKNLNLVSRVDKDKKINFLRKDKMFLTHVGFSVKRFSCCQNFSAMYKLGLEDFILSYKLQIRG